MEVVLDLFDEGFIAVEACGGNGAVDGLTVVAVVLGGDIGGDEFALAGREGVWGVEKDFYEIVEWPRGFGAEGHCAADAGETFGKFDVCHGSVPFRMEFVRGVGWC